MTGAPSAPGAGEGLGASAADPPTPETKKRVDAAKQYIENLYKNQERSLRQRMERRRTVQNESLSADAKSELLSELEQQERKYTRLKRAKLTADDFEPLTIIGRGAFGEVRLVRDRAWPDLAMKKLKKQMVRRGQVDHVKAERNYRGGARRGGREAVLLVPGRGVPVPGDGVPPGGDMMTP